MKTKYNGTIPWQTLSYRSIASFSIEEGLRLCNESKIQNKLNSSISNKKELGRFCDQYGCKGIEAPSTSRRKKVRTHPKPYNAYRPREKYQNKPVQPQKPTYSKRKYTPTKTHKGKKQQTSCKCREEGHYANTCPIRGKINELDIDQELKNQLLQLALTDSEQSSEGEILKLQEESDSYSSTEYKSEQEGRRMCEGCINVLTKDQEILLEVVEKIQDPEIQQKIAQRLKDAMTISKPPEREERNPYRLQSVLRRFEKPRELTTQDLQREINNLKQEVQVLRSETRLESYMLRQEILNLRERLLEQKETMQPNLDEDDF